MKIKHVLPTFIGIVFFAGCSAPKQLAGPAPTKQTFTYGYKTANLAAAGSAGTLIGLIRPMYAVRFLMSRYEIFENFQKSIGDDIEALLIDKGFRLQGTFQSIDDMVFSDKKESDIAIEIEIDPKFSNPQGTWKTHMSTMDKLLSTSSNPGSYWYSYEGTVSLVGKINIKGREPLSNEIIWRKSLDIPVIENVNLNTSIRLREKQANAALYNDPAVYNAIGTALQEQYKAIMQKIDAQFDPREFTSLKPQIKELKTKKGY